MKFKFVFFFLFFLSLIYVSQLFVIYINQYFNKAELNKFCYALPLIIIFGFALLLFITKKINDSIYSVCYYIMGLFLGYLLYIFQVAIIIWIFLFFIPIQPSIGLFLFYVIPLLICIYGLINALRTKLDKIYLKYPGYREKITILHLTDIHLGAIHQKNSVERIIREILSISPDIVVITGDMADGSLKVKPEWLMPFDTLDMPILYVTGNHEEMNPKVDMINAVNQTQIKYIGKHQSFFFKGVNFIGEDFGYDLRECLENFSYIKREEGVPNVLLSHIPVLRPEELGRFGVFLFLAGHTHGGQLFPFHIFAYWANACFSGLYSDSEEKHHVYVSEGVNNAVVPMRVLSSRIFGLITI